jgi:molybdopterin/thiamine biosynthesis adenylyltransferase
LNALAEKRVLIVGAGGIGAPAAWALVLAGVRRFAVADDDRVELSNLHRQILFRDADVGKPKLEAFGDALGARGASVELVRSRALPSNVVDLVSGRDVVIDATDNFASRFLLADGCRLAEVPIVHAAAVRWSATVLASAPRGAPCYRCLFEDFPDGDAPDCASAGVLGPICGVAGALAAELAIRVLDPRLASPFGLVFTFDGRRDRLRSLSFRARPDCQLCGATATVRDIDEARYDARTCEL